jgi:hypothetical protein
MITILLSVLVGFVGGFFAGVKNSNSSKVAKAKDVIANLKK